MSSSDSSEYRHLLLTKFNILTSSVFGDPDKRLQDWWLRQRVEEFESVCLPSVRAQTCRNFTWIVFLDSLSPAWFKDYISSINIIVPIYVDGPLLRATIGRRLVDSGLVDSDYLITTRLDNDDALASDFIESVQYQFARQEFSFIQFLLGYRLLDGGLYHGLWWSNPFLSLVEKVDGDPSTVYMDEHQKVARKYPTVTVPEIRPMWLRSIHASNTVVTHAGVPAAWDRSARFTLDWSRHIPSSGYVRKFPKSIEMYGRRLARSRKYRRVAESVTAIATRK